MARVIIRRVGSIVFPEPVVYVEEKAKVNAVVPFYFRAPAPRVNDVNYPIHSVDTNRLLHTIPIQPEIMARQKLEGTYARGQWLAAVANREIVALSVFVEANGLVHFQGCWELDLSVFTLRGGAVNYIRPGDSLSMFVRNTGNIRLYWHSGDGECLHHFTSCNTYVIVGDTFNLVNLFITVD